MKLLRDILVATGMMERCDARKLDAAERASSTDPMPANGRPMHIEGCGD
jgi:hypothetical protein